METFFATFVSASLIATWVTSHEASPSRIAQYFPSCKHGEHYAQSATLNAASLASAEVSPFGRKETGWQVYAPQVGETIGTHCAPTSVRFAAKLSQWQSRHRLRPTGAMDSSTLIAMKQAWQSERLFIKTFDNGCPEAAQAEDLADARTREGWQGKQTQLTGEALAALRRMIADARKADPRIAKDKQVLTIVSAYRSPEYDAAACANGRCNGVAKAKCSAHRTGTAVDLYVGAAPGFTPVSSDDANRLFQTKTPAYLWLVKNASRYGFVNYVFEPWHWEWVGKERVAQPPTLLTLRRQLGRQFAR